MSTFKVVPDILELRPEHISKYYILIFKSGISKVRISRDVRYIYTCIVRIGLLCGIQSISIITDKSNIYLIIISRYILCK